MSSKSQPLIPGFADVPRKPGLRGLRKSHEGDSDPRASREGMWPYDEAGPPGDMSSWIPMTRGNMKEHRGGKKRSKWPHLTTDIEPASYMHALSNSHYSMSDVFSGVLGYSSAASRHVTELLHG